MGSLLLVVDDDEVSRAVLEMLGEEAGFRVVTAGSGEEALAYLALHRGDAPAGMLVDLQMPGLCGEALAGRLRGACGEGTVLAAMSGTAVAEDGWRGYDRFLLKPLGGADLASLLGEARPEAMRGETNDEPVLSEATYRTLAESMPEEQLRALYELCLHDAERRLGAMRRAMDDGDVDAYRRAAHAVRGSCGMLGAMEMAALAAEMEEDGFSAKKRPIHFAEMPVREKDPMRQIEQAAMRLRAMLNSHR